MITDFGLGGLRGRRWRIEDFHDVLKDIDDRSFVNIQARPEFVIESGQFACQLTSVGQESAHFYERANDKDTHLDGARGIEHVSGHNGAMLGKGARENR